MINIKRNTEYETRYHEKMGVLICPVTTISICFLGIPFKTIHKYRETYHGEVKDCEDCVLSKV